MNLIGLTTAQKREKLSARQQWLAGRLQRLPYRSPAWNKAWRETLGIVDALKRPDHLLETVTAVKGQTIHLNDGYTSKRVQ